MSNDKTLCGFYDLEETPDGYEVLGVIGAPPKRPPPRKTTAPAGAGKGAGKKSPSTAVANAVAAMETAKSSGQSALKAGQKGAQRKAKDLQKIQGLEECRQILGAVDMSALDADDTYDAPAESAYTTYEIVGMCFGASPTKAALAAQASRSRAALQKVSSKARGADAKVAKANKSVDKASAAAAKQAAAAVAARDKGGAAVARAQSASADIASQVARLQKAGYKVIMGASPEDMVYRKMPADAVEYSKDSPWERYSKGSLNYFKTQDPPVDAWGLVYGWVAKYGGTPTDFNPDPNAGGPVNWVQRTGNPPPGPAGSFVPVLNFPVSFTDKDAAKHSLLPGGRTNDPSGKSWGPLVGNPNNPKYKGLRYAVDDDKWFWLADEAPEFATKERDDAVALLEKTAQEAADAAKEAADAEAAEKQATREAEAAELQAKNDLEDAALARAAQVQAEKIKQEAEAAQAELQAEEEKEASAAAIRKSQADTEAYEAQQRFATQQEQQRLDWERAHPEQAYAQPQYAQGGGGGYDQAPDPQQMQTLAELAEENERWAAMNRGDAPPEEY